MSLFYKLAYWVGFTPWENAAAHPPAARQIAALFDREERERHPPFGRALDLGCGTGYWSLVLAQRGWQVTGVELIRKAVRAANRRAQNSGFQIEIVRGDITALRTTGISPGFNLFWDFGTMHGLTSNQRQAAGREITALATPDATILMLAWTPGRRGPLPRGASAADLEQAFNGWKIIANEPFDATGLPRPLRNVDPHVYRLRRA